MTAPLPPHEVNALLGDVCWRGASGLVHPLDHAFFALEEATTALGSTEGAAAMSLAALAFALEGARAALTPTARPPRGGTDE